MTAAGFKQVGRKLITGHFKPPKPAPRRATKRKMLKRGKRNPAYVPHGRPKPLRAMNTNGTRESRRSR